MLEIGLQSYHGFGSQSRSHEYSSSHYSANGSSPLSCVFVEFLMLLKHTKFHSHIYINITGSGEAVEVLEVGSYHCSPVEVGRIG